MTLGQDGHVFLSFVFFLSGFQINIDVWYVHGQFSVSDPELNMHIRWKKIRVFFSAGQVVLKFFFINQFILTGLGSNPKPKI